MKDRFYTPQEIDKKMEALPQDIQGLVYSARMLDVIQGIGAKYKLHIDQIGVLEAEVADVMIGFTPAEKFVPNLVATLSLDKATAENIAKDINDELLIKIRESMKKSYYQPTAAPPPAPVAPAPVAPPAPQKPTEPHPAELMLSQKTVTTAPPVPSAPAKPEPYKADPYREPTN